MDTRLRWAFVRTVKLSARERDGREDQHAPRRSAVLRRRHRPSSTGTATTGAFDWPGALNNIAMALPGDPPTTARLYFKPPPQATHVLCLDTITRVCKLPVRMVPRAQHATPHTRPSAHSRLIHPPHRRCSLTTCAGPKDAPISVHCRASTVASPTPRPLGPAMPDALAATSRECSTALDRLSRLSSLLSRLSVYAAL